MSVQLGMIITKKDIKKFDILKNSTQDLEDIARDVFWDEQLSRFRDAAVVMPDSVFGKATYYTILILMLHFIMKALLF